MKREEKISYEFSYESLKRDFLVECGREDEWQEGTDQPNVTS